MSKSKGAAKKAAPAKKRARRKKTPALVPEHLLVPVNPGEWPPNLTDEQAEAIFEEIECGATPAEAAEAFGMKLNTVWKWKERHTRFADRLTEAMKIGAEVMVDGYRKVKAFDRDSAAGANIELTKTDKYLSRRFPERFHVNPFKPSVANGNEMYVGVVVVPAKQALLPHDVVDAEFTTINVPAKAPA